MSIFQKSIVKKHISSENQEVLKTKWNLFTSYFHNVTIQENIYNSKEEQFQEGFLRELFVKVLGYTLNPEPNFNLTTEYKNIKDSKKADGAIIINNTVTAVIELKGTATTDLGKVESQAFNYKNNQHQCLYVITSNFEKLRFYIDNAIEHIEFNLFKLSEEEFHLLYLCLAFKNIENNVPKNIKDESVSQEDVITKKLYNNYSLFKRELHHNLVALNPGNDALELFQKSQKLLDRFLFIFFAEDRGLLPTNLIFRINKEWQQLREMRIEVSLYDRYKIYFSDLNVGAKVSLPAFSQTASNKKEEFQIYAYNGGLFKEDDELNTLKIDDELLFKHTEKLSNYDFASEVDVNILGHIFENSLNELDEIKSQIEGQEIDKTKTKRKKDGVFYTPKYITKYIVDNTVGKLCIDKKAEFKILEEEYITDKKRNKNTIQNLAAKLSDYRNWLLKITICDPACGSGAFLNQALDFLINEHKYIDELQAKLFGDAIVMSDVEQSILENNIFGVDINEESVEIAKLSLWLRTAQPNRKLNDLNSNIKCGNSLIDDVAVAGDKAFNWEQQFTTVFENGGFDVIIGNPPYGAKFSEIEKNYCKKVYAKSTEGKIDSYRIFIEKCFDIAKHSGLISLITPNTFLYNLQSYSLRELILNKVSIYDAVELRKNIFEDAPDVVTVIISFKNELLDDYNFRARVAFHNVLYYDINTSNWDIDQNISIGNLKKDKDLKINLRSNFNFSSINSKITKFKTLDNYFNLKQGTKPYGKKEGKEIELLSKVKTDETWENAVNGRNISRYFIEFENDYVQRSNEIHSLLSNEIIDNEKIYFQRMRKISLFPRIVASYDNSKLHGLYTCSVITKKNDCNLNLKYLLGLLNSKLINLWYKYFDTDIEIKLASVKQIPIPNVSLSEQNIFINNVDFVLDKNTAFEEILSKFYKSLRRKFQLEDISKKLKEYYLLSYSDFIKELAKKKIKLSLAEEAEWEEYFNTESKKALSLKSQIDATDKEIDQLVYKLYDLTEEEIAIVEKV